MSKILIVEDEPDLASLLKDYLQKEGFSPFILSHGYEAVEWIRNNEPDLILLDLMLPGKDGMAICQEVRAFSDTPIIITTAKVEEIDRLLGLESGADDYVCKPYSPKEVVARVKVILRRVKGNSPITIQGLEVDKQKLKVYLNGSDLNLTAVEFNLFKLLHNNIGTIFTREQIMKSIYDDNRVVSNRTIDSHIKKIRKKIHEVETEREILHSVYGAGYKLEDS